MKGAKEHELGAKRRGAPALATSACACKGEPDALINKSFMGAGPATIATGDDRLAPPPPSDSGENSPPTAIDRAARVVGTSPRSLRTCRARVRAPDSRNSFLLTPPP